MTVGLRSVAVPFVADTPRGVRVRTRLRLSAQDEAVLQAVGRHLGSLAGRDLAARCAEGRLDAAGRARSRATRKQALTAESASDGPGRSPGPARTPTGWPSGLAPLSVCFERPRHWGRGNLSKQEL